MKYKRFEELPVWQAATDLAELIFTLAQGPSFRSYGSLRNQLERATLSISNNIAEGFERGTTQELLNFLYIARGSAGEVRSMLCLLERLADFKNLRSEISDLKSRAESISRQLRAWGRHDSEHAHQGSALSQRQSAPNGAAQTRPRRISARAPFEFTKGFFMTAQTTASNRLRRSPLWGASLKTAGNPLPPPVTSAALGTVKLPHPYLRFQISDLKFLSSRGSKQSHVGAQQ